MVFKIFVCVWGQFQSWTIILQLWVIVQLRVVFVRLREAVIGVMLMWPLFVKNGCVGGRHSLKFLIIKHAFFLKAVLKQRCFYEVP